MFFTLGRVGHHDWVTQPAPSPSPSPIPSVVESLTSPLPVVVTDVVRDGMDKWSFGLTIGSAVIGLLLSGTAVWLAYRAYRVAIEAKQATAEAEVRAIERATRERRVLFELEILRDLMERLRVDGLHHLIAKPREFRRIHIAALRVFPTELPTWQFIAATTDQRQLYEIFDAKQADIDEYDKHPRVYAGLLSPGITQELVQQRLLADLEAAVDARMKPIDLPHTD